MASYRLHHALQFIEGGGGSTSSKNGRSPSNRPSPCDALYDIALLQVSVNFGCLKSFKNDIHLAKDL